MKYKLVITVLQPNPAYSEQLAKYEVETRHGYITQRPPELTEVKTLETVVSEEEFKAIRDAVLKTL